MSIALGPPGEDEVARDPLALQEWVRSWQSWSGHGRLVWQERRWRILGAQTVPQRLVLETPAEVAGWLRDERRWARAKHRFDELRERWPELVAPELHFEALADTAEEDWQRVLRVLEWLAANPSSDLYPRQIPLSGMDTKWFEGQRSMLQSWLGRPEGLRAMPFCVRLRLLDPELRRRTAGLSDLSVPLSELIALELPLRQAIVVENLQTGLSFHDLPGTLLMFPFGYSIDVLASVPWLRDIPCFHWGDLDTHGFSILSRARNALPQLRSLLMDEATLLAHRDMWVREEKPSRVASLTGLNADEHQLYDRLRTHHYGPNVRLEQERIDWAYAWKHVQRTLA